MRIKIDLEVPAIRDGDALAEVESALRAYLLEMPNVELLDLRERPAFEPVSTGTIVITVVLTVLGKEWAKAFGKAVGETTGELTGRGIEAFVQFLATQVAKRVGRTNVRSVEEIPEKAAEGEEA